MALPELLLLDTNCFVYLFEDPASSRGSFLATELFARAAQGRQQLFAATLTVTELLSFHHRSRDDLQVSALRAALESMPNLSLVPLTVGVAAEAARLRGLVGLSLPDSVVLATSESVGAAVLTNDRRLAGLSAGPLVLVLDDLV